MTALVVLLAWTLGGAAWAEDTPAPVIRYVLSDPDIPLRTSPGRVAAIVTRVPRGTRLEVTGRGAMTETIAGVKGAWVPVRWNGTEGWLFDGFLSALPTPPVPCDALAEFAVSLPPAGAMLVEKENDCDCPDRLVRSSRTYAGGIRFEQVEEGRVVTTRVHLPETDLFRAWMLVRECVPMSRGLALPTASGAQGRLRVVRAPDRVQVTDDTRPVPTVLDLQADDAGAVDVVLTASW